ncbi:MAG TPA: peptide ABC transporter substrate-binding protein [Chloroflexota bacterium]|nr:peptide ABC transporter substrate-binding protein [Chloroflexota bacterium]
MHPIIRRALLAAAVLLAACAPSPKATTAPQASVGGDPRSPKVLTIAIQTELKGFLIDYTQESKGIGGVSQPPPIAHDFLLADDGLGNFTPRLAAERPSVENGLWVLNPDGSMEMTWKLRPNIEWHDGVAFTADDLVFSGTVCRDPEIPCVVRSNLKAMDSLSAPDPRTLVVRWSAPYANADQAEGLTPLPKHLLEDLYQSDKANLVTSPRFSTEFVGLGPYRLVRWEPGSHLQFARFGDYYLGRPPLDQVFVRFLGDPNTMVAAILSGAVDVVLPLGVSLDQALEVRDRWQGTGNQVLFGQSMVLYSLYFQLRPDLARPPSGVVNPVVRRGIYHAIDRAQVIDAGLAGVPPPADSWVSPKDPLRPQLESAIPQYPFDVARAQSLLADGDWARGGDGVLVHQGFGDRFELEISAAPRQDAQRMQAVMREEFKQVGIDATIFNFPAQLASDNEMRSTRPGVTINGTGAAAFFTSTLHSRSIPGPENRWGGSNWGAYSNPRADALLEQLGATIPVAERVPMQRELLQIILGDVALAPLYWNVAPVLALEGVTGIPAGGGPAQTWNFFEWDKR